MKKLSIPQENVYNTHNFFVNTAINNIGGYIILKNNGKVELLAKAINLVLEKNDALRIRIKQEENNVWQYIKEYEKEEFEVINVSNENIDQILEEDMQIPLDVNGKLYQFKILKCEGKIGIYIKLDHLISDAWSISLVANKILTYYEELEANKNIEESCASYCSWLEKEEKYLSSEKFETDKKYWEEIYNEKPVYITMSPNITDRMSVEANRTCYNICGEKANKIFDLCNKYNISLAVLFEALVIFYASRINNTNDATICSIVINRNGIEEKNTVGMFNNILPLTVKTNDDDTFLDLCQKISTEHFSSFRHQKYPLNEIIKYIKKKFGTDTSIYDIMVSYQNMDLKEESIEHKKWIFNGTSDLGFMLNISESKMKNEIAINIDWRKNCFEAGEIEKIYARLMHILNQFDSNKNILLKDIEIVTSEERKEVLIDFNNTQKDYPKDKCIHIYLEENVKKNPNKEALRFLGNSITYKEFNDKANALAHYIHENVKGENQIIGVMCERSFEMMIAIYAILKAGHAYMPIAPDFPEERIQFMLEDSKAQLVLTQTKFVNLAKDRALDLNAFDYTKYSCENLTGVAKSTDVAYVIYTSGSTGKPKGAMIEHHQAINRIKWMHEKYLLEDNDVILQKTPYTFDVSVWELFWWSMYNQTLEILIPEGHKDPTEIIKAIEYGKVTHIHFVPSMLNMFLEYLRANPEEINKIKTLKYVFASGEALQSEQVKTFYKLLSVNGTTLHNLYGPTECAVDVSYYDCVKDNIPTNIPIGKPIDNTQLVVLNKDQQLMPIGIIGELYISGVQVGRGYINRDELTKEKFVPNKFYNFKTMYRTGDLARILPDGNIEYYGRTDFQIKIRGLRVELGDISNAILQYDNITQAVTCAVNVKEEKEICAYFVSTKEIEVEELKKYLSKKLPDYMIPTYFVKLENIPTNANGKADTKKLPLPEVSQDNIEYVEPENDVERIVYDCVCKSLEIEKISCTEDLINNGLSSLGVISTLVKLSEYGYEIKVKDFYEYRTIKQIAEFIQEKQIKEDNVDEYKEDREIYSNIADISKHKINTLNNKDIFITGATSFLGIHIIQEIYTNTKKKIYCLIRNEDKFIRFINKYTDIQYPNDRIIAVKGDISNENLDIPREMFNMMNGNVSDVIHCAANVSFFCDWDIIKKANYIGTCNVVNFTEKINAKLHHISTMSVSGDILTRQTISYPKFTEEDLYIGQLYKENVYAHSKYLAEKYIISEIRKDKLNASIYRIANLTWRESDGGFQENYAENDVYILTKVMKKYNCVPLEFKNENICITPVDDCAKAITTLMKEDSNTVFNIYSKNSMTIREYMNMLCDVKYIPLKEFCDIVKKDDSEFANFVSMYINGIVNNTESSIVKIIANETNAKLEELGFEWKPLGSKYVNKYNEIG